MLTTKRFATALALTCITISSSVYACGTYKDLSGCSSPKEALNALSQKNPSIFGQELVGSGDSKLALFEYDKSSVDIADLKKIETASKYEHYTFTLKGDNPTYDVNKEENSLNQKVMSVNVHYYKSLVKDGKKPLIIGFPTIMKFDKAEPMFSKTMSKKGLNVMILEVESIVDPSIPLPEINNIMRRSIIKARMMIDVAGTHFSDEVDTSKIGTWGLSLGGVRAATFIGVDRRVTAAFIISAGGNNADIFSTSEQSFVIEYRNKKLEENSFNVDQYYNYIRKTSNIDPLYYAHRVPTEQINMIIPRSDTLIPTRNQVELWDAFGQPGPARKNWVRGEHKNPIYRYLVIPNFKTRIFKFFKKRFEK